MNLRHRCPNAASARQTLIAGALALFLFVLTEPAQSAQVVLWFVNPWTAQNDTNAFVAQGISTNILANGGVQAVGLPVRIQPSQITGLATNYFGLGWYSVKDAAVNGQYVINVYDSGSSLYYYTNLLQSGFNTYVVVTYGSNPPPSYNSITNALGYVPDATNAALNATNPIPAWISATNTASLVISTGLVQNATNPIPGWISYSNTANLIITTGLVQNATSTIPALVTASTNPIPGWITAATNPITGWISATNLANLITTTGLVQNATSSIPASITAATNPVPTWITAATNPVAGWISASSTSNLTAQTTASNANYWLTIYTLSQVGKYTNSIQVTGGSGTYSSCNGILDWCGGNGWTNSTAATVSLTNDVNGSRFIISGVSVAGAIGGWPVGSAFTNISGSGTLPATTFFTNQDVAGANLSIANVRGTKTFTAAGSGSATNVNFLSSSNVTAATVSSTNIFFVPANTFDSAGAAQGATNALQQEITNSLYTIGGALLNSNNINGRIQNANAPFDISASTNSNASKINGTALGGLGTGILKNTTGTGVPSIASAGTDYQAALTSSQIITVNNAPTNASGTNATVFSVGAGTVFGPTNFYWPGDQRVVTNNQVNFPVKSIALSTEITDGSGNELIDTSGNLYNVVSTLSAVLPQLFILDDQNGTISENWKLRTLNGPWTSTNMTATGSFSGVGTGLTSLSGTAIGNAGGAMVATLASGGVNFTNGSGQISKAGPYSGPTWSGLSFYGTNSTSGNNVTSLADLIGGGSGSTPGFYLNYGIFSGNGSSLTFLNASNMASGNSSSSNVWNGKFVGDISSATNISAALNNLATPSILTNAIGVMENAIYYTTNSIIGSVGFGSSSNNVLYFPVASNAWASAFGTWIFPDSALNFLMINPDGTTNYSRGGSPIGTGWTVKGGIAPGGTTYWTNFPLSISLSNQMVTIAQLYGGAGGAAPTNLVNNGSLAGVISTAGGTNFIGTNVAPNTLNMLAGNNAGGAADSGISVISIVSNQVPVEYFGATGGSHDDTAAFQLALNSGKNIILNGATNYTIGNVWASNRNVYLDGAGATVYFLSTASNYMVVCTNLSTTNLTIKNVVLNGNKVGFNGYGNPWIAASVTNTPVWACSNNAVRSGVQLLVDLTNATFRLAANNFSDRGISMSSTNQFPQPTARRPDIDGCTAQNDWVGIEFGSSAEYVACRGLQAENCGYGLLINAGNVDIIGGLFIKNEVGQYKGGIYWFDPNGNTNDGYSIPNPAHGHTEGNFNHCRITAEWEDINSGPDVFGGTAYGSAVFIINNANNVTILGDEMDNPAEFYNNQASIEGTGKSGTNFLYYKGDFPAIQVYTTGTQPLYTNWFQTFNVGQLYGNINNATNYDITKLNPANLVTKTIVGYIGVDASGAIGTNTPAGGTGNGNASTNNATVQYWSGIQNLTNVSNTYAGNANSLTNGNAVASISGPMLITNGPTGTVVPSYNGSLLTNGNAVVSAAGPMMMTNGTGQLVPTYNGSSLTNLNITGASGTFTGTVIATNFAVSSNNVAPTAASPTNGQFWFDGTDVYIYWTNFTTGLSGTNRIATMKSVPTAGQGVAYDSVNKTFYPTNINTFTTLSNAGPTIATFTSSTNTYSGVYVQNQSGGTNASGEVGAIANNGTTTSFSTFFGINNGGFSNPSLPPTGTNTAYWLFFGNASNAAASFGGSGKIYGPQTNAQLAIIMGGGTNAAGSESWTNMIVDTNGVSIGWPFKLSGNGSGLTNISASATNIGVITITNSPAPIVMVSTNGQGLAGGNQEGGSIYADTNNVLSWGDTNAGTTGGGSNLWITVGALNQPILGVNVVGATNGLVTSAGYVGEVLTNYVAIFTNCPNATLFNVTNLTLTAGSWAVSGWVTVSQAATTVLTNGIAGIGTTTLTLPNQPFTTAWGQGTNTANVFVCTNTYTLPTQDFYSGGSRTVYVVANIGYRTSTAAVGCYIRAQRTH